MRSTVSLLVYIAILWHAHASAYHTTPRAVEIADIIDLPDSDGDNVELEPDMGSVLRALEMVQMEQVEMKEQMRESQARVASVQEQLHEENSQLRQQQQALQDEVSQALALGEEQGSDQAQQLSALNERVDRLEALLTRGQTTGPPSTSPPSTRPPTTSTTTFMPSTTSGDVDGQQLLFSFVPEHNSYGDHFLKNSVLVTSGGKLIIGDQFENTLRMSSMHSPSEVEHVYNIDTPWSMLELNDGTIAVTAEYKHEIQILKIADGRLKHVRDISTEKTYFGIAHGPHNTLVVSDRVGDYTSASLDVINMDGIVMKTLLTNKEILIHPFRLARYEDDVYVTDWTSNRVFRVNVFSGQLSFIMGDLDLHDLEFFQPRSIDLDSDGNLYIATGGDVCRSSGRPEWCIVQVSQSGSWRMMEDYVPLGGAVYPYGLDVTSSKIVISWGGWSGGWFSELTAFTLPESPEEGAVSTAHPGHQGNLASCVFTREPLESGGVTNVALNKPALQSSYHPLYGHPEIAVDGCEDTEIKQCTHTADVDTNPNRWWRVDLMGLFEVESVYIVNRGDCCGDRLVNFDVYVMETLQDPSEEHHDPSDLCLHNDMPISDGGAVLIPCRRPIVGQYVSLVLNTDQWPLHFCEIEVFGRPASERGDTSSTSQTSSAPTTIVHSATYSTSTPSKPRETTTEIVPIWNFDEH